VASENPIEIFFSIAAAQNFKKNWPSGALHPIFALPADRQVSSLTYLSRKAEGNGPLKP
jgi:hypothetical protein